MKLSLEKLQLNYVDLYLIHMPFSFHCSDDSFAPRVNDDGTLDLDTESDLLSTWKVSIFIIDEWCLKLCI